MRNKINHITKTEFLPAFIDAFNASITKETIKGGFRGTGLVPFNAQVVINQLDVQLKTPPPPPPEQTPWQSKTPSNAAEIGSQSTLVIKKYLGPRSLSPIGPAEALEQLTKGALMLAHHFELLKARNAELEAANAAHTKWKLRKRQRLQTGGTLSSEEGQALAAAKAGSGKF